MAACKVNGQKHLYVIDRHPCKSNVGYRETTFVKIKRIFFLILSDEILFTAVYAADKCPDLADLSDAEFRLLSGSGFCSIESFPLKFLLQNIPAQHRKKWLKEFYEVSQKISKFYRL